MEEFNKHYKLPITHYHGMFFDARNNHILDVVDQTIGNSLLELLSGIPATIKVAAPVKYAPTKIIDVNSNEIISIRGWGRLQYIPNGAEIQDAIGNEIAELINSNFNQ